MAKELRAIIRAQFEREFGSFNGCVMIDYARLNAEQTLDLRSSLRADGVRMRVVHNRLAQRVLGDRDDVPEGFLRLLRGPTALLMAPEGAIAISKSISSWRVKNKDLAAIKGGLFEGRVLSVSDVGEMAKIPDKATLLAQTAGMFLAPVQFLPSAARSLLSHFAGCVKARHEQLSGEG